MLKIIGLIGMFLCAIRACDPLQVQSSHVQCVGQFKNVCAFRIFKPTSIHCQPHIDSNTTLLADAAHWTCRSRSQPWIRSIQLKCATPCIPDPTCHVVYNVDPTWRVVRAMLYSILLCIVWFLCYATNCCFMVQPQKITLLEKTVKLPHHQV